MRDIAVAWISQYKSAMRHVTSPASLVMSLVALLLTQTARSAPLPDGIEQRVDAQITASYPALFALYKDVHQHPEIAFQETRTAALLAKEMRTLGFKVTERVGGTGVVAVLENGAGPTVMIRTELDALPLEEKTGLPYASLTPQAMHACGHDVHMAAWVGAAKTLVAMKEQWQGRLLFIAQPAEETIGGAKAMLADALLTRFPRPDFGFALHVSPAPAGTVAIKAGTNTSAADSVEILFKGRGGHGSMPSATIDPIVIAARFVTDVQSIVSREKDAGQFGVITVGAFQAGTVGNIIPDSAALKLTLRSYSPQVRQQLLDGVQRVATASALVAKAPAPEVKVVAGTAAVVSDASMAEQTAQIFSRVFGKAFTLTPANAEPVAASEDYSEFITAGVPSLFFGVGVSDPAAVAAAQAGGPSVPVNHSPQFAPVPEPSIKTAVRAMTFAVLGSLRASPGSGS